MRSQVGLVIFENVDGIETGRATYTRHPVLRSPELFFKGIWHLQNRQEHDTWVYRAVNGVPGVPVSDPALEEVP